MTKAERLKKLKSDKLKSQNYKCGVCGRPTDLVGSVKMNLDHCHVSGIPREMLCSFCNMGLGCFFEDVEVMKKAIEYLNKYEHLKINRLSGEPEEFSSKKYKNKIFY